MTGLTVFEPRRVRRVTKKLSRQAKQLMGEPVPAPTVSDAVESLKRCLEPFRSRVEKELRWYPGKRFLRWWSGRENVRTETYFHALRDQWLRTHPSARSRAPQWKMLPGHIPTVDLHDLTSRLACEVTRSVLDCLEDPRSPVLFVRLVTGWGKHTTDGKSRNRLAVRELVTAPPFSCEPYTDTLEPMMGWFDVYLHSKTSRHWGAAALTVPGPSTRVRQRFSRLRRFSQKPAEPVMVPVPAAPRASAPSTLITPPFPTTSAPPTPAAAGLEGTKNPDPDPDPDPAPSRQGPFSPPPATPPQDWGLPPAVTPVTPRKRAWVVSTKPEAHEPEPPSPEPKKAPGGLFTRAVAWVRERTGRWWS